MSSTKFLIAGSLLATLMACGGAEALTTDQWAPGRGDSREALACAPKTTEARVARVVARELRVDWGEVTPNASLGDLGMDAQRVAAVVSSLEEEFGTDIPNAALAKIVTVRDMTAFIDRGCSLAGEG